MGLVQASDSSSPSVTRPSFDGGRDMTRIVTGFELASLPGEPRRKSALLIAPPVYDTQYWSQWSQPYGLLRIAALLKKHRYKRIEFFDFMEVHGGERIHQHRINVGEEYSERDDPE